MMQYSKLSEFKYILHHTELLYCIYRSIYALHNILLHSIETKHNNNNNILE